MAGRLSNDSILLVATRVHWLTPYKGAACPGHVIRTSAAERDFFASSQLELWGGESPEGRAPPLQQRPRGRAGLS